MYLSRSPIRKKRSGKPRRGRVIDKARINWLHTQPCAVSDRPGHVCSGRLTVYHVRRCGSPKCDDRALPLCEGAHLWGASKESVERGKQLFEKRYGVDLEVLISQYRDLFDASRATRK